MGKKVVAKIYDYQKKKRYSLWILFFILVYVVFLIKYLNIKNAYENWFFLAYSFAVSAFLLSRFLIAHFYIPSRIRVDEEYTPSLSFGIPSKNEEENIQETILRIANIDYPKNKFEIIAVNDGSTDNTLGKMLAAQKEAQKLGVNVRVINFTENQGKRHGMAACCRASQKDIMVFVDSDSFVEKDTAHKLAKYFYDPKIGAVTAHAYVANENENNLTKMQAVKYFVAFKAQKGAESIFGAVTCCSGSCAAYRRSYVMPILDKWLAQKFLGVTCTYGDDRSLTNALLAAGHRTIYAPDAKVYTIAPDNWKQYLKQQLRWKKSWFRECVRASAFIWKKNLIMSSSFYLSLLLPLLAPIVIAKALVVYPITQFKIPYYYFFGVFIMAIIYGLYYHIYTGDRKWVKAVVLSSFVSILMAVQLFWAILTIRDAKWGTR